jgi:hypothetical protein
MTVELIGILTLVLGIIGLFRPTSFIVRVFLASTLLGSAAAFVLEAIGGTNISPAHLLLGFLAYRLLNNANISHAAATAVASGSAGFWLLLAVGYSLLSAYFLPVIFAGQTYTFAVRNLEGHSQPLALAMSNLTQSIYLVGDLVCFILLYGYAGSLARRRILGEAALWCAALNLVFAALDLATYFTNTTELMSVIRNANYTLLNDTEVAGIKRIVGSFTEASSFGSTTLGYFAFTSRLWLLGIRPRLSLMLMLLSLLALVFSTSTTAYVGLAVFLLFSYLQVLIDALHGPLSRPKAIFLGVLPAAVVSLIVVTALNDDAWASMKSLLDTLVFNKMSTDSGIERSSWNRQALQNFYDTFGFGVGNGSVRASSFPVGLLASLGIPGAVLFGMFFIRVFFNRARNQNHDRLDDAYVAAAKSACVAWLITATTSGALIDLGLSYYAFAALASARSVKPFPAKASEAAALLIS